MMRGMATYVLVHGGWSGAHGFRHVRRLLHAAGHECFTPSLTGLGERAHLASPQVRLSTHVEDVVNHLLYEDHRDVVLLGHSYGGMVITAALEHVADRIEELVYLDAFVPRDAQSTLTLIGMSTPPMTVGMEWLIPPAPRDFDDPAEAAFIDPRRVAQPLGCFAEPVRLPRPIEEYDVGLTYIRASAEKPGAPGSDAFDEAARRAASSPRWRHHEIATNHMVASNRPRELTDLLLALA
jgi:pimeloyl-ACP methyl ester carboxylesterase